MSRLFDTLEQIRENEANPSPPRHSTVSTPRKNKPEKQFDRRHLIALIFFLTIIIAGIYAVLPRPETSSPLLDSPSSIVAPVALSPDSVTSPPDKVTGVPAIEPPGPTFTPSIEAVRLNNQAVALTKKQQYSQGLYLLSEAHRISPGSIAPLINLGVAYTEFGLIDKGMKYFEAAYKIDPVEPALLKNLAILDRAGLLNSKLITKESFEGLVAPVGDPGDAF